VGSLNHSLTDSLGANRHEWWNVQTDL
jgi:hypothetical protein